MEKGDNNVIRFTARIKPLYRLKQPEDLLGSGCHIVFCSGRIHSSASVQTFRKIGKKASIPSLLQAAASFVTLPANAITFAWCFFASFATPTGAFPMAV